MNAGCAAHQSMKHKLIYSAANYLQADYIKGLLEQESIATTLSGEHFSSLYPGFGVNILVNEDKFLEVYVKEVIKDWKGLKYDYVSQLLLINTEEVDMEDTLDFSQDNAQILMKNSSDFDTWVTEVVGDLENFTKDK